MENEDKAVKIMDMTISSMRDTLLSNGFDVDSAEVAQLSAVPKCSYVSIYDDGSAGYYDRAGDYQVLLYPGTLDTFGVLII